MKFKKLGIMPAILKAIKEEQYVEPTEIQDQAIPLVLTGRDVLGCAQTGTGKTAAFAIPTLQRIVEMDQLQDHHTKKHKGIRSLILTPTRELAIQIKDSFHAYGRHVHLKTGVIFGGVPQGPQEKMIKEGLDVLVATPGRLNDLMNQGIIKLDQVKILILDEADRMLDMGFIHDVKRIVAKVPAERQTLLFSATMPKEISALADAMLKHPAKVSVTPEVVTVEAISQSVYLVNKANKRKLLIHLLKDPAIESVLVFTRTKHGADRVVRELVKAHISAMAIHGDKSQNSRQNALENFRKGAIRVLVATDIAARGIDIDELSYVINFDLPNVPETYVHRIGRTGRAGLSGIAMSFCDVEELPLLKDIEKTIGKRIPEVKVHPFPLDATVKDDLLAPAQVKAQARAPGKGPRKKLEGHHKAAKSPAKSPEQASVKSATASAFSETADGSPRRRRRRR
ncbi:DEAD/DEAH box helicase [Acidaminobacter hydrogenoformans]|uniref:ATP-dependent RNA helicase CshA n=1 Tax=Acidaminobacter hydrogenoformans DSM 2784 TaxID=1120920 RepID=A0A1G5S147_9FIRM|nr:DEAD/DEAH box helicase [Acidaminobacter hydrogenoformans]SCZ80084.1 ATP-dependent RNA helicase RhlE [Acidaminobacter hydrogenoformans DSM 2784]